MLSWRKWGILSTYIKNIYPTQNLSIFVLQNIIKLSGNIIPYHRREKHRKDGITVVRVFSFLMGTTDHVDKMMDSMERV